MVPTLAMGTMKPGGGVPQEIPMPALAPHALKPGGEDPQGIPMPALSSHTMTPDGRSTAPHAKAGPYTMKSNGRGSAKPLDGADATHIETGR